MAGKPFIAFVLGCFAKFMNGDAVAYYIGGWLFTFEISYISTDLLRMVNCGERLAPGLPLSVGNDIGY